MAVYAASGALGDQGIRTDSTGLISTAGVNLRALTQVLRNPCGALNRMATASNLVSDGTAISIQDFQFSTLIRNEPKQLLKHHT